MCSGWEPSLSLLGLFQVKDVHFNAVTLFIKFVERNWLPIKRTCQVFKKVDETDLFE